ncbi:hypothetical protein LIA77_01513 [Sarocladium implicatum]|nr:hypothetical protein LIA77_01513 [Sarocladium implicatum]
MTRLLIPINLLLLLHPFTTLAIPTTSLFSRQSSSDTCPSSQSACPDLPSGLCCPSGTDCIPLAGKTTVLCCAEGTNCDRINPITCNIEQQDPDKNPRAPIKTSVFDVELETCGDGTCCPFGFSCHEGKQCRMNDDQEEEPGKKKDEDGDVTSTSASAEPTGTGVDVPSSTGTEEAEETATNSPSDGSESDNQNEEDGDGGSSGPDTTTIIGGVVGGIAALLAVAIILFVCARRRANRKPSSSSSSFASNAPANNSNNTSNPPSSRPSQHARNFSNSSGTRGNIISEPIMQQNSYRTDFMLKTTPATASTSAASTPHQSHDNPHPAPLHLRNSVHPHISTIRDHDDPFLSPSPSARTSIRSSTSETNNNNRPNSRLAPIRAMRPQQQHRAQPSSESINIFADPTTVDRQNRYSMGTTVSGLMIDLRGEERRPNVPGTTPRI